MSDGIRARNRAAIEAEILAIGTRHLEEHGAAALSLRAVARDLGMASSAVYRYVENRDELLTRLIVAAFNDLGDHVDEALRTSRARTAGARLRVIARTFRSWALANPHQFSLIYGSPVPGYAAPAETTNPAGTRVQEHLLRLVATLDPRPHRKAARLLAPILGDDGAQVAPGSIDPGALLAGIHAWHLITGAITSEIFEQFGPDPVADADAYFETVLDSAERLLEPAA